MARVHGWARFLVPLLVTLPRFRNHFVFDDVFVIAQGDFIHDLRNLPLAFASRTMAASSLDRAVGVVSLDTYRPLSIATFFVDAALSGRTPWAYHLTSALAHALCTMLVGRLLARLVPQLGAAQVTTLACVFGLSPWLTEAHVFINGRSDVLLALCLVSGVLLHQDALARESRARALASGVLVLLGLLAKETMVLALPFVVLAPLAPGSPPCPLRRRAWGAGSALVALGGYLVARAAVLHGLRTHADGAHLARALANLPLLWRDTLTHALLPTPYFLRSLRDDYAGAGLAAHVLAAVLLLATLVVLARALRRRAYVPAWGLALALATVAPATLITTALWQGFGRYLYLPAVGLLIALGAGLAALEAQLASRNARLGRWLRALCIALCVWSGLLTLDATLGFHDDLLLYERARAVRPEQAWTHGFLGLALRRSKRCEEALPLLATADRMAPDEPRYAAHLGRCLLELGRHDDARSVARAGQRRFHDTRAEAGFLVTEFLTLGHGDPRAVPAMRRCLQVFPGAPECQEGLAAAEADVARTRVPP